MVSKHIKKIHNEIKKANLKPVELKKKENKQEEAASKENSEDKNEIRDSSFHESILEESIGFKAPVIESEEKEEKKDLEETAKEIQVENKIENQNQRPYASTSSSYMNNPAEGDMTSRYRANDIINTSTLSPRNRQDQFGNFSSSQNSWENSSTDDFQKMQDQYKSEREETTNLPFQQKRKRHDIF